MSLPFLKPKAVAGLIISHRKPDGGKVESHSEGEENQGLESCMEDLIRAIQAKDSKAAAQAFKDAFEVCESYPHDEASENDYDARNEDAAEEQE